MTTRSLSDALGLFRPADFGARGDDATDDTRALLACAEAAAAAGTCMLVTRPHRVGGRLVIACDVEVAGAGAFHAAGDDACLIVQGTVRAGRRAIFAFPEREAAWTAPRIRLMGQTIHPEWFGAAAKGAPHLGHDDSAAWQQAMDALMDAGGAIEGRAGAVYPLRYPLVLRGRRITIDLNGAEWLTDLGRKDRAPGTVFTIGDSREWNRALATRRRLAGDLFNNFENPDFSDIPLETWPEGIPANDPLFSAVACTIFGGTIAYYDDVVHPGNYGVQFANCRDCHARHLVMRNTGQAFGFGSDVAPRNPYAVNCTVSDLTVTQVNLAHTYYGAGFHGYARNCHDANVRVLKGATPGTPDGNLWAANFALDCTSRNTGGECGRGQNGEGFSFGVNARRCRVYNGAVENALRAFVNFGPVDLKVEDGNAFVWGYARDVDVLQSVQSRHCHFIGIRGERVRDADILLNNVNGSGNVFRDCDRVRIDVGGWSLAEALKENDIVPAPETSSRRR